MKKLLAILAILIIAGCSASDYKIMGWNGGYSETQIAENVFQIRFRGNSITPLERAADFALLRSAEVTLEYGYNYFTVAKQKNYIEEKVTIKPARIEKTITSEDKGKVEGDRRKDNEYIHKSSEKEVITFIEEEKIITKIPHAYHEITCYKNKPSGYKGLIYDADFLVSSLKRKYKIK